MYGLVYLWLIIIIWGFGLDWLDKKRPIKFKPLVAGLGFGVILAVYYALNP